MGRDTETKTSVPAPARTFAHGSDRLPVMCASCTGPDAIYTNVDARGAVCPACAWLATGEPTSYAPHAACGVSTCNGMCKNVR